MDVTSWVLVDCPCVVRVTSTHARHATARWSRADAAASACQQVETETGENLGQRRPETSNQLDSSLDSRRLPCSITLRIRSRIGAALSSASTSAATLDLQVIQTEHFGSVCSKMRPPVRRPVESIADRFNRTVLNSVLLVVIAFVVVAPNVRDRLSSNHW